MIKANELRIGNWVGLHKGRAQIENGSEIDKYSSKVQPIPLAEDWLFKFGFTKKDKNPYFLYSIGDFVIGNMAGKRFTYKGKTPLEFVHQLQNLYFALTGEELQLKQP